LHWVALGSLISLWACNPSDFDHVSAGMRDARAGDASSTSGSREAGSSVDATRSGDPKDAGSSPAPTDSGSAIRPQPDVTPTPPACPHAADPSNVHVSNADVGALAIPSWVANRTASAAARVGDRALVLFAAPDGTSMAGWGSRSDLMSSPPHLDEHEPFVPLFAAGAVPGDASLSISSALEDQDGALIFFVSSHVFLIGEAGLARVPLNGARADVLRAAGELFPKGDQDAGTERPWMPAFVSGPLRVQVAGIDYIYLYGCQAHPDHLDEESGGAHEGPCRLARVPRADVARGERYKFWNGSGWSDDAAQAAVVMDHVWQSPSVAFNRYLGKYLALHSDAHSIVALRWADRPEGPWQPLGSFMTLPATGGFATTFAALEHPALRDACEQVLYVSYIRTLNVKQTDGAMGVEYTTRLTRVELE
jgi:hypothetical protein